jgi:LAO/AO transport system kinase
VGIVAIDPTSPFTQGALLGDRIRMGELAMDDGVFMRSMATRGNVGGLSRSTRMVVDVLEAFGKDVVLVETVGVGQAEMDILDSVDTSVVVLMPDMGDSVQIMKAGLLEIADVFVLNKADRPGVEEMDNDLNFFLDTCKPERFKTWRPPVVRTRADQGVGVDACVRCLQDHRTFLEQKNLLEDRKRKRLHKQIKEMLQESLQDHVWERFGLDERIRSSAEAVARRASNPLHETEALVALVAGGLPGGAEVTHD